MLLFYASHIQVYPKIIGYFSNYESYDRLSSANFYENFGNFLFSVLHNYDNYILDINGKKKKNEISIIILRNFNFYSNF